MIVRLVAGIVVLALPAIARADDALTDPTDSLSVNKSESLFHDPGEPLLTLDIVPRPNILGLGVAEDTQRTAVRLTKRASLAFTGTSWKGYADAVPLDGNERDIARGYRAAVNVHYDAGWLQLDAELSQNMMSSQFGGGRYRDISLTISKQHKFSRWVTGWIGLSLGNRQWEGDPPPGEAESSWHLMLTIGATFR